ncbi:hypothetical protein DACRYDRAFT_21495 [Dacryopinax primogenitus]|uniref:Uncharacterized protein n=1 Tax=Dacryopinax primogenitus (strain DJM 731) TaxID=1858805 RepID=M5GEH8_DACPD|nr:uncharacterized protein DACRYDRAFT_21495 [Dacryopinax primogenitus]EJU03268.1 hypothetical protein DACRYDRAFT_21495 [Dacryopinax primogenitus]
MTTRSPVGESTVHSTATHNSADAWQMPLHNKDRLFLVLLPTVGTSGEEEWALLLTPKREKKGAPESTLFRVFWEETEKGPWLSYHSRTVDATALPMLARWLLLKIRPGQQEFFDDELSSVDILQEKGWRSRGWVGSCLSRLRELGFGEIREPKAVEEEVGRWRTAVWDRGGRARGETVADLRLRS